MTSNVGSDIIYRSGLGFKESDQKEMIKEDEMNEKVLVSLRENFKPEFLNRLDEIIIFHPINQLMIRQILELQLNLIQERLREKDIKLKFTKEVKKYLAQKGFDPAYGARPLRRIIQSQIMDELALEIVEGKISDGDRVTVDVEKNQIVFKQ
jgi:ATP-dependent Clp protease ATP-binding subunit ClpC